MAFSGLARRLAFLLLALVAIYAAYLSGNFRITQKEAVISTAAQKIAPSREFGDIIICGFAAHWQHPCARPELPQGIDIPELAQIDFGIRYLCPVYQARAEFACADKSLVGAAGLVLVLVVPVIVVLLMHRCWRSRDRADVTALVVWHALAGAVSAVLLWQLMQVRLPYVWMGNAGSNSRVAGSVALSFTGDMIGYCLLIALIVIALVGVLAGLARLKLRA